MKDKIKHDGLVQANPYNFTPDQCLIGYKIKKKISIMVTRCVLNKNHHDLHEDYQGNKF